MTTAATNNCELCGWLAAICSMFAFGTFGVPIKSNAARSVRVDPLVFQSYKSLLCFLTAWLVLCLPNDSDGFVPFTYTPWGIVSGLFWVPGGVATVYAVQTAGLAVAIGLGSSCIVLVSFIWGIFIFKEPVQSKWLATLAIVMMLLGILGMSYFQNHSIINNDEQSAPLPLEEEEEEESEEISSNNNHEQQQQQQRRRRRRKRRDGDTTGVSQSYEQVNPQEDNNNDLQDDQDDVFEDEPGRQEEEEEDDDDRYEYNDENDDDERDDISHQSQHVVICGRRIRKRTLGLAAAVYNGVWGGSIMVPMHWSGGKTKGMGYVISFAIGAMTVTIFLWILRFLLHYWWILRRHDSSSSSCSLSLWLAYQSLPSFHVRVMWLPGAISGTLWSIGNFFSMISVQHLGEATGYSVVQAAMLVSGLWGIFYFHEVKGVTTISKWFASATLTVAGILLLSFEHHNGKEAHHDAS